MPFYEGGNNKVQVIEKTDITDLATNTNSKLTGEKTCYM